MDDGSSAQIGSACSSCEDSTAIAGGSLLLAAEALLVLCFAWALTGSSKDEALLMMSALSTLHLRERSAMRADFFTLPNRKP